MTQTATTALKTAFKITLNDVTITNTVTKVLSVGGVEGRMSIEQAVSMGVNDTFYQTDLKFENLGSSTMTNVRYMRNADPDPETDVGSGPTPLTMCCRTPTPQASRQSTLRATILAAVS